MVKERGAVDNGRAGKRPALLTNDEAPGLNARRRRMYVEMEVNFIIEQKSCAVVSMYRC